MTRYFVWFLFMAVVCTAWNNSGDAILDDLQFSQSMPCVGNSWVIDEVGKNQEMIGKEGIKNWTLPNLKIGTYFKTEKAGTIDVILF